MTPKEEAKRLVERFKVCTFPWTDYYQTEQAKKGALICVDEILDELGEEFKRAVNHWNKVKEEIQKL